MTSGLQEPGNLQDLLRVSEEAIAKGSKSFAAAARLFKPDTRHDVVMLYAWCRHADDLIDGQSFGHDQIEAFRDGQEERLSQLRRQTIDAVAGKISSEPVFNALGVVTARNHISEKYPLELVDGFEMDVQQRIYRTPEDTMDYCYHVAGVVGVMMALIMAVRDDEVLDRASDLGIAFQLTNIARDIIDDAKAGRVYLPQQWLDDEGIDTIDPSDKDQWPALHRLAMRLIDSAAPYYASAFAGLSALPWRSAWAIAAARRVYRDIGEKLRAEGPDAWENRVSTSSARKAFLLFASLMDVAVTRLRNIESAPERRGLYERPGRRARVNLD